MATPLSSAASERSFSAAGNIASVERNRLSPENVHKLLFLKYNLRAVGYHSERLPLPLNESEMNEGTAAECELASDSDDPQIDD